MELPEEDQATFEQMTRLEELFEENVTFSELRHRFYVRRQQVDESLTHFAVACS